ELSERETDGRRDIRLAHAWRAGNPLVGAEVRCNRVEILKASDDLRVVVPDPRPVDLLLRMETVLVGGPHSLVDSAQRDGRESQNVPAPCAALGPAPLLRPGAFVEIAENDSATDQRFATLANECRHARQRIMRRDELRLV